MSIQLSHASPRGYRSATFTPASGPWRTVGSSTEYTWKRLNEVFPVLLHVTIGRTGT